MEETIKRKKSLERRWNEFKINKLIPMIKNKESLFYYVLFLIILAFAYYAYTIVANGFTAPITGDYTAQTIPFFYNGWDDWWHFFKTGEFPFWDANTVLGADNLANNSFYYVMDPFFIIALMFPRSFIPHALLIIMMLKMIIGTLIFRKLLLHFNVKEIYARFFAICYGFGGWIIFYSWFESYMGLITFFPLVVLGIEKILAKEKPFTLIWGLFLVGLSNFYFLVPGCIGGVIYAMFRYFQTIKTRKSYENLSTILVGIFGFALGLGLAAFLTLPAFMNALTYYRSSNSYLSTLKAALDDNDWGLFFGRIFSFRYTESSYGFRVAYPLMSFLFPVTDGRSVSIMNFSGNRYDKLASSLFCYSPCIIIFFASVFKSIKEKKVSHILAIAFWCFCLFVPFFYYMFLGFSSAYGRWEFLPSTFLIMYCAISFNKREEYKKWMFDFSYVLTIFLMIIAIYLANLYHYQYPSRVSDIGSRWPIIIVQIIYITVLWILFRKYYLSKKFVKTGFIFLFAEIILVGAYFSMFHGYTNYYSSSYLNGKDNLAKETEIFAHVNENDSDFFRVQSGRIVNSGTNIAEAENYNGISYFHSTYNSNLDQFLHWSRIVTSYGNWTGNAVEKRPLLDEFLGVKYYLAARIETNYKVIYDLKDTTNYKVYHINPNIPFGYNKVEDGYDYGSYELYKNDNFINFGYSYSTLTDPHIREEDNPIGVFSDFYTTSGKLYSNEALVNDYNFMSTAILETSDIKELKEDYSEAFSNNELSEVDRLKFNSLEVLGSNNFSRKVYRLPYYFDPTNPLAYETIGSSLDQNSQLTPYCDIVVYEPKKTTIFNTSDEIENALFFISPLTSSTKYNIFLINENNEVVTYDNFLLMNNYYKTIRTMYMHEKISKIIMVPCTNDSPMYLSSFPNYMYRYRYSDYLNIINNQKQYQLYDCSHTYNTYTFKTNYDSHRMIVLNVPYDKGWSCTKIDANGNETNAKVYKAQGGFVAVMSDVGETTYKFNFISYYFKPGAFIAGCSIIAMISMGVYYSKRNKRLEEESNFKNKKIKIVKSK